MNYELAKKLKEAGFPLKERIMDGKSIPSLIHDIPTLSELMEACGEEFEGVLRNKVKGLGRKWLASTGEIVADGGMPEEAVAELWLKIKNK